MTEPNRPVWLVRAGRHGQDEDAALEHGLAIIGFVEVGDLSQFGSAQNLAANLQSADPEHNANRAANRARQLWTFAREIQPGDFVVLPRKGIGQVAIGRVKTAYRYQDVNGQRRHVRGVEWIRPDVPRSAFRQDLLHSLGAFMTVCEISRNDARRRVAAVASTGSDPGDAATEAPISEHAVIPAVDAGTVPELDIEQAAHDEVVAFTRRKFPSHDMARLVEALLQADGFVTHRSAPGPDGGADILAAKGPHGLDGPTLCVQVKATAAAADVTVFRGLQGSMASFSASQGLLVCWGGFTQAVRNEARQHVFRIRLWDQTDLVRAIYRNYDKLPEEIQAELPLKRVWVLVREESDDE
jgi:restriction system protein